MALVGGKGIGGLDKIIDFGGMGWGSQWRDRIMLGNSDGGEIRKSRARGRDGVGDH